MSLMSASTWKMSVLILRPSARPSLVPAVSLTWQLADFNVFAVYRGGFPGSQCCGLAMVASGRLLGGVGSRA